MMQNKASIDLHELSQHALLELHAAWRYRWHALILAWCVAIVGAVLVFTLPNQYESSAQVYADTSALTNPLLKGVTVQPGVRQRLELITHTLLSRPNLETVADKTGLSLRATTPAGKAELLDKLGASVRISGAGAKNLYNISYTNDDRKMAQKVVQAFVQILMNETLGENTSSNVQAKNFLQNQVDNYSNQLNVAEHKLAAFKKANMGYLPSHGGGDYFTRLQSAKSKLQNLEDRSSVGGNRESAPRRQVDPRVSDINQQIAAYQRQLNTLLLSYTDRYPGVVSIRSKIKRLQARRKALPTYYTPGPSSRSSTGGRNAAGMQSLAAQIASQKQNIADLEGKADKIADVQMTLQQLTRNYDTTKKQYNELKSQLNKAELSQAAIQSGNNLNFRVISPSVAPLLPVSPKRGLLLLLVFVFALCLGAAFAYFLHLIKPVFTSLKSLRDFSDYPVIGNFQFIQSRVRRAAKRGEIIGFCAGVCFLVFILALSFAYSETLANMVQHVFVVGVS